MLLKTLEEPGHWSLLVLVTTASEALLPTILSRCQRIRFRRIPERLIVDKLVEKMDLAPEHAQVLAKLSSGSIGRALELAGKDFSAWRVRILDEFAGLLAGKTDPLETARKLLEISSKSAKGLQERRVELRQLLDLLLTYVRDLVIAKEKYESSLLHGDRQTLVREAELLDEERALRIFDRIFETKDDIDKNVNMQLALEELCLDTVAMAGHREGSND
jgi:DNA polymerase-3 subunit delta'